MSPEENQTPEIESTFTVDHKQFSKLSKHFVFHREGMPFGCMQTIILVFLIFIGVFPLLFSIDQFIHMQFPSKNLFILIVLFAVSLTVTAFFLVATIFYVSNPRRLYLGTMGTLRSFFGTDQTPRNTKPNIRQKLELFQSRSFRGKNSFPIKMFTTCRTRIFKDAIEFSHGDACETYMLDSVKHTAIDKGFCVIVFKEYLNRTFVNARVRGVKFPDNVFEIHPVVFVKLDSITVGSRAQLDDFIEKINVRASTTTNYTDHPDSQLPEQDNAQDNDFAHEPAIDDFFSHKQHQASSDATFSLAEETQAIPAQIAYIKTYAQEEQLLPMVSSKRQKLKTKSRAVLVAMLVVLVAGVLFAPWIDIPKFFSSLSALNSISSDHNGLSDSYPLLAESGFIEGIESMTRTPNAHQSTFDVYELFVVLLPWLQAAGIIACLLIIFGITRLSTRIRFGYALSAGGSFLIFCVSLMHTIIIYNANIDIAARVTAHTFKHQTDFPVAMPSIFVLLLIGLSFFVTVWALWRYLTTEVERLPGETTTTTKTTPWPT